MDFDNVFDPSVKASQETINSIIPSRSKGETTKSYVRRLKKGKLAPKDYIKSLEESIPLNEQHYQTEIWKFLERLDMFPVKFENQGTFDPTTMQRRFIQGGTKRKGVSDLFFFCGGCVVFCEVKVPEKYTYILRNWDMLKAHVPKPRLKGVKKKYDAKENYQEQIRFIETVTLKGQIGFFADGVPTLCNELLKRPHLLTPFQLEECSRLATPKA